MKLNSKDIQIKRDVSEKYPAKPELLNINESFGIDKQILGKISYNTLEKIFYGMHNFDVPELYPYLNPAELLGLHAGIYKKYDDYKMLLKNVTLDIILSKSVAFGYESSGQFKDNKYMALYELSRYAARHNKNIFSTEFNALRTRMRMLDKDLCDKIITELIRPPEDSIPDPNIDGHGRNAYIYRILNYYESSYNKYSLNA